MKHVYYILYQISSTLQWNFPFFNEKNTTVGILMQIWKMWENVQTFQKSLQILSSRGNDVYLSLMYFCNLLFFCNLLLNIYSIFFILVWVKMIRKVFTRICLNGNFFSIILPGIPRFLDLQTWLFFSVQKMRKEKKNWWSWRPSYSWLLPKLQRKFSPMIALHGPYFSTLSLKISGKSAWNPSTITSKSQWLIVHCLCSISDYLFPVFTFFLPILKVVFHKRAIIAF